MMKISFSEAFLMFAKWRDEKPQIQLGIRKADFRSAGTRVSILDTSESDANVDTEMVVNGQNQVSRLDFRGASFSYGEPADSAAFPEFAERVWSSYLLVECPSGNQYLFAERRKCSGE